MINGDYNSPQAVQNWKWKWHIVRLDCVSQRQCSESHRWFGKSKRRTQNKEDRPQISQSHCKTWSTRAEQIWALHNNTTNQSRVLHIHMSTPKRKYSNPFKVEDHAECMLLKTFNPSNPPALSFRISSQTNYCWNQLYYMKWLQNTFMFSFSFSFHSQFALLSPITSGHFQSGWAFAI